MYSMHIVISSELYSETKARGPGGGVQESETVTTEPVCVAIPSINSRWRCPCPSHPCSHWGGSASRPEGSRPVSPSVAAAAAAARGEQRASMPGQLA